MSVRNIVAESIALRNLCLKITVERVFIRPCFNFAHFTQLTVGEFKARVNKHSHIECMVYIVAGKINKRPMGLNALT